jgi:hypothetical protein
MIAFHVPKDRDLLAAFGEVALRHEHLNHILRMTIKTLARLSIDEALDATTYDGSRQLRERIRKLARQRLGEGEPLLKLEALLERCKRATERRNELVHGVWAKELDGEPVRRMPDHTWHPLPSVSDLMALGKEIESLTGELNTARLEGFLSDALAKRA